MAQVINTNSLSLLTQNNLNKSQSTLGTAIERLSSSLRINSAKDDAAGQAIANRFTSNIKGLTQASRNANDGISLAQTTEGALNEINNNLQRVRELAVQSSNQTNSDSDLSSIQAEIQQRLNEIDRVSGQTQFNGVKVLSETQGMTIQVGANDGETITINLQEINSETLGLTGFGVKDATTLKPAAQATTSFGSAGTPVTLDAASTLDAAIAIKAPGTGTSAGARNGQVMTDTNGNLFVQVTGSDDTNENGYYSVTVDNDPASATVGQLTLGNKAAIQPTPGNLTTATTVSGSDGSTVAVKIGTDAATASITNAKLFKLQDANGKDTGSYALIGDDGKQYAATVDEKSGDVSVKTASYTDASGTAQNNVKVQLGGSEGKTEVIKTADGKTYNASDLSGKNLKTDTVTSISTTKATDPLTKIDAALAQVDALRSDLGAVQNRFDSAITNLGNTVNNLTSARSRIEDADYATEVSNMSKAQILQQAGTSVLAQANQVPQGVLSLLR